MPEVMPCTRLLRLDMALPSGERGPALFLAFSRLALICAVVAMNGFLCVRVRCGRGDLDRGSSLSIALWGRRFGDLGVRGVQVIEGAEGIWGADLVTVTVRWLLSAK